MTNYNVKGFIADMGSYTTTARASYGETAVENALWDFNSARRHDGLEELTLEQFKRHIRRGSVEFTPQT